MATGGPTWGSAGTLDVGGSNSFDMADVTEVGAAQPFNHAWWVFTAPSTGLLTIDMWSTVAADYDVADTQLSVYDDASEPGDLGSPVAFNDDSEDGPLPPGGGALSLLSQVVYQVDNGVTYHILASSFSVDGDTITSYVLSAAFLPATDTGWIQPGAENVRQRMSFYGKSNGIAIHNKIEFDPPIDYATEFVPNVLEPVKDTPTSGDLLGVEAEEVAAIENRRWFSTLPAPDIVARFYRSDMRAFTGIGHLQDYDPVERRIEMETEILAAKAAETGLDTADIQLIWEVDPAPLTYPWGTYENRVAEVSHEMQGRHVYDVNGVEGDADGHFPDPFAVWTLPVSEIGDYEPGGIPIQYSPDLFAPEGSWLSGGFAPVLENMSPVDVGLVGEELTTTPIEADSPLTDIAIDDSWWDANAWPILYDATDYQSLGLPLAIGYDFMFNSDDSGTVSGEGHEAFLSGGQLWMRELWTPPRYRLIYYGGTTAIVPPRRIFGRSDGGTHGGRRALGGGNTVQSGPRTLGGIL